ncbi:MAG: CPBP family intramembrane metalloprotease [Faecalibacterium sp.]|nr:CPBP family intramembrane metalloprotease [Faecalibacterium sp.]
MVDRYFEQKFIEKREIRQLGFLTGSALICYILLQDVFALFMRAVGLLDAYINNALLQTGIDIIFSVVDILVPFMIFGRLMKKQTGIAESVPLSKPKDKTLAILAVPAGLGLCMAANVITTYIVVIIQSFGCELSSPDLPNPQGAFGFVLSFVRVAVIAAMVEEISLRGYVMQPLRKYGDNFAIVMSACAFGLMHCNLVQAPFALIAGIGLGYICIKTNSMWLTIIIHSLNNAFSIGLSYLLDSKILSENVVGLLNSIMIYGLIIIGIPCLLAFIRRARTVSPSYNGSSTLSNGEKVAAYIGNPTMIVAIVFMLYFTAQYISRR